MRNHYDAFRHLPGLSYNVLCTVLSDFLAYIAQADPMEGLEGSGSQEEDELLDGGGAMEADGDHTPPEASEEGSEVRQGK